MSPDTAETRSAILAATVTAAAMIAFQVGAKATRDALFLSTFGFASLPGMVMVTALVAIGFAFLAARALTAWGPGRVIPFAFAASATLLLIEWAISFWSRPVAAVLLHLHCGCLGGLLISGFWSFVNERFDPRTAKRRLGPISAWSTLGGLLGGLIAAWVGRTLPVAAMFPILAAFHLASAAAVSQVRLGAEPERRTTSERGTADAAQTARSGLHALAGSSYLRGLMLLVLLVTISESFLDFVLKGRAAAAFGEEEMLRFFAVFYAVASLLAFVVQALAGRIALEKLGPARTAAALPAGVAATAAGVLVAPGLATAAVARGVESVISNSLYRAGYEILFTPVPPREKRPVKALADVGVARIGDLVAAGVAGGVLMISLSLAPFILTAMALAVSTLAVLAAMRLHRGYVRSLERGLHSRAVHLDLSEVRDSTTRSVMVRTLGSLAVSQGLALSREGQPATPRPEGSIKDSGTVIPVAASSTELEGDSERLRLRDLRSLDSTRVLRSLREGPVSSPLVPHVVSLLAWDDVAREAIEVLRRTGPAAVEPLIVRLLDPQEEFAVRRRIPLVLATYQDQRAVEGLARGLGDRRFEVRYRCGRGLSRLLDLDPALRIAPAVAYEAVLREVEAGAGVWEGRRLLDQMDDDSWSPVVDEVIRKRANRSLEHVFTLLALVLPRQPLRIAFRGLHVNDALLRGTALEYLECALPAEIRKPLWPYLEDNRPRRAPSGRPVEETLARLIQSSDSIVIHLEELKRKGESKTPAPGDPAGSR